VSPIGIIVVLALLVAFVWGLVALLSNPVVQGVLVILALGSLLVMLKKVGES